MSGEPGALPARRDALRQYAAEGLRPQTLLFTLLGRHVRGREIAVSSGTLIAVLDRLGVSTQAARSTLARMVRRGHLVRHRVGRKAYFSVSRRLAGVLEVGNSRIFSSPIRHDGHDAWTLLAFSIPESQRAYRYNLRTVLAWNGFGLLRNGLYIAPGVVDVPAILEDEVLDSVEVFTARPAPPTDLLRVVTEAWDLDAIAGQYEGFLARWAEPPADQDALAAQIRVITEWQQILVDDPELPVDYLPSDWPALDAYELFQRRHGDLSAKAAAAFESILDALPTAQLPSTGSGEDA